MKAQAVRINKISGVPGLASETWEKTDKTFLPQVCPPLDHSFRRRLEQRLNVVAGVVIGAFVLWTVHAIFVAVVSGHLAAVLGGHR